MKIEDLINNKQRELAELKERGNKLLDELNLLSKSASAQEEIDRGGKVDIVVETEDGYKIHFNDLIPGDHIKAFILRETEAICTAQMPAAEPVKVKEKPKERHNDIDREWIRELYFVKGLQITQIANETGYGLSTIHRYLKELRLEVSKTAKECARR